MIGLPLMVPYLANQFAYDPGPQPYAPGQSDSVAKAMLNPYTVKPWPKLVPTLLALASTPGVARTRAPVAQVNRYSPNPENYLFIAGFSGKSKG